MAERSVEFGSFRHPPLPAGTYDITVDQYVNDSGGAIDQTFHSETSVEVRGERFALDPGELNGTFPPDNNRGHYSGVLPSVVLTRATLPWERSPGLATDDGAPWLAVLLFEDEEMSTPDDAHRVVEQKVLVADLQRDPRPRTEGGQPEPGRLPADVVSYADAYHLLGAQDAFDLDAGEHWWDSCAVIDVPIDLFFAIAPNVKDVHWVAHVRSVPGDRKTGGDASAVDEVSVVVGTRLPEHDTSCTAHLVSIEGMGALLPDENDAHPSITIAGTTAQKIRLVSLARWQFRSEDADETFDGYMTQIQADTVFTLRRPSPEPMDADLEQAFALGYTALDHRTRLGDRTVSWYRGPLVPWNVAREDPGAWSLISAADQAVRYDPGLGMFDVSYAAAWELGRLLALGSTQFSQSLSKWKRACTQHSLSVLRRRLVDARLATIRTAFGLGNAAPGADSSGGLAAGLVASRVAALPGLSAARLDEGQG